LPGSSAPGHGERHTTFVAGIGLDHPTLAAGHMAEVGSTLAAAPTTPAGYMVAVAVPSPVAGVADCMVAADQAFAVVPTSAADSVAGSRMTEAVALPTSLWALHNCCTTVDRMPPAPGNYCRSTFVAQVISLSNNVYMGRNYFTTNPLPIL